MARFRRKTVNEIADMICGNGSQYFEYRTGSELSEFFEDCYMEQYVHDGSTRKWWVANVLLEILGNSGDDAALPSQSFQTAIQVLMDRNDAVDNDPDRATALEELNRTLARDGLEAFYAEDNLCYVRNLKTGSVGQSGPEINRALSREEKERRKRLEAFIHQASEDELTAKVIIPLLQTLKFQRMSIAGHTDKAMEFGKDVWMKYCLPTGHWLYFGLQIKRGKIDSAARTKNENIAEVHSQILMMLGHEIFDPEVNRKILVDHAFLVAGGEITKQAKHWLGERLDASQRRQIIFMDQSEILHLFVMHNVPMPDEEEFESRFLDGIPI